jgi:hypothetical protein
MSESLSDDFMASYDAALRRLIDGVANRQRVVDAALARKAGCICSDFLGIGLYALDCTGCATEFDEGERKLIAHDPCCPQAIAEAIEKGGEG